MAYSNQQQKCARLYYNTFFMTVPSQIRLYKHNTMDNQFKFSMRHSRNRWIHDQIRKLANKSSEYIFTVQRLSFNIYFCFYIVLCGVQNAICW